MSTASSTRGGDATGFGDDSGAVIGAPLHLTCGGNLAAWPPGLAAPPEIAGAPDVLPDNTPFIRPSERITEYVRAADACRAVTCGPTSITASILTGVATKGALGLCVAHAVAFAPIVAPVAGIAAFAAGLATGIGMGYGPIKRLVREHVRGWFCSVGGGLVDTDFTDPGYTARDAADDEAEDAPPEVSPPLVSGGRTTRRRRKRHFAPYSHGKVRGAYLAALVAEVRTLYAGRARDSAAEHGARRALVTRMKEHGMRPTDIDRCREACVNAVFYVSLDDEAAAQMDKLGRWLGLQRGPGPGA
nr:hypothetical protein 1 [Ginkgo biloba tombusvirus]